jgi:hypothetical protein
MEIHISPDGDDNNSGTSSHPLKTIQQAQKKVREIIDKGLEEDIQIILHGGTYRLTEPLLFDCRDSGTDQYSITYKARQDQEVILSGGTVVSNWQKGSADRWIADPEVDKVRELFINNQRAIRARHPNQGYFRAVKASEDRMSYFRFNEGEIPYNLTANNSELVFIHDWSISRIPIENIDPKNNRLYPLSKIGRQHPMMVIDGYEANPRYFIENDPAICDTPGEWCQDTGGRLIYFPKDDQVIEDTKFIIPVLDRLLSVRGDEKSGCTVTNLHFEGLVFEHCSFYPPDEGYAGVQATFHMVGKSNGFEKGWRGFVPAALQFELTENCSFTKGVIRHIGGAGIMFGSRTKNCYITDTQIYDVSGNGVMIGESRDRIVDDQIWWKSAPQQAAQGNKVANCIIENAGVQYFGAVGIWVGLAQNTRISHNEIRNLPYTGVSIGWMWNPDETPCKANIVEYNHIHHVMQILSDGGGIYTLGYQPGTILSDNLIHDIPLNAGRAESNGMFLDEGTTDIVIRHNGIYNTDKSPLRFHKAGVNQVIENVLGIVPDLPPVRYNRTEEKNIHLIDNKIILSNDDDKNLEKAIKPLRKKVGLRKQ